QAEESTEMTRGRDADLVAEYALGHTEQELQRLMAQARRYEPFTMQLLREAGIESGMRVFDVGSGSGDVSFLLARLVGPSGQVVGIDRSAVAVATAARGAGAARGRRALQCGRYALGSPGPGRGGRLAGRTPLS